LKLSRFQGRHCVLVSLIAFLFFLKEKLVLVQQLAYLTLQFLCLSIQHLQLLGIYFALVAFQVRSLLLSKCKTDIGFPGFVTGYVW
jgi:hypothetical protein